MGSTRRQPTVIDRSCCPHPEKHVYSTKRAAKKTLKRRTFQNRDQLAPYRCDCGGWHLGHKPGSRKNHSSVPRA